MDKTYKDGVMDTIDLVMEATERVLVPERILKSGPATIVFWRNGQKTIVKCSKGTEPDDYSAFCAAFTKHIFGTNSKIRRILKDITVVQEPKKKRQSRRRSRSLSRQNRQRSRLLSGRLTAVR